MISNLRFRRCDELLQWPIDLGDLLKAFKRHWFEQFFECDPHKRLLIHFTSTY